METFIVRVWTPSPELGGEVASDELRGVVERVGSKEQLQFGSASDLLDIMSSAVQAGAQGALRGPERV